MRLAAPLVRLAAALIVLGLGTTVAHAATSSEANPSFTFTTAGAHTVQLTVCNAKGCDTIAKTVVVADPRPVITLATGDGVADSAVVVHQGDLLHVYGAAIGQPQLAFGWQLFSLLLPFDVFSSLSGAETWWNTAGVAPGAYAASLHVANASGVADSLRIFITVLPPETLAFFTLTPCRMYDSRLTLNRVADRQVRTIPVVGCDIPANARALSGNLTIVAPDTAGQLNLYAANYPVPGTTEIAFGAGRTRANSMVVRIAPTGTPAIAARPEMNGGAVDVVFDVNGYFAPITP